MKDNIKDAIKILKDDIAICPICNSRFPGYIDNRQLEKYLCFEHNIDMW